MKRFWPGRRDLRRRNTGTPETSRGAQPGPRDAGTGLAELSIDELEPRLAPNYPGTGGGNGPNGDPSRTVGWGC